MSASLLILVTLIYVGIVVDSAVKGNWPMAVVFTGYAFANVGLIMVA